MRLQSTLVLLTLGLALSACNKQTALVSSNSEANNPFRYSKKSAVCKVTPVTKQTDGSLNTTMTVRSDDGQCEFIIIEPKTSGSYVTFGVPVAPEHGKAFLYNHDNRTYVRYTPTMAYAGTDKFTASMIHQDKTSGETSKTPLNVEVTVDNTGVQTPKTVAPTSNATSSKKTTTRRKATTHRKTTTKKTTTHKKATSN